MCAVALLLLGTFQTTAWSDAAESCTSATVADILQRGLQAAGVAAGALVVLHDGKIDYSGGFGQQTPGGHQPTEMPRHRGSRSPTT
jgi:CubicO group peptidase (beta-lactamase class C family)